VGVCEGCGAVRSVARPLIHRTRQARGGVRGVRGLSQLSCDDSMAADLVKLRYYAGMSVEEAADALGISRTTAYRHWTYARAWIRARVQTDGNRPSG
jgi:DNA invertase Pin-like site-specific DNA recombinase